MRTSLTASFAALCSLATLAGCAAHSSYATGYYAYAQPQVIVVTQPPADPTPVQVITVAERTPRSQPARELLVNPGFESPALAPGSWNVFPTIDGWQTSSGPGVEVQHRVAGSPAEGNQHIELDSHGPSSIYQDVRTEPGATYQFSLQYSPRPGTGSVDGRLEVWFDGQRLATLEGSGEQDAETRWHHHAWTVRASSPSSRIELRDAGAANSLGAYLDGLSFRALQ